MQRAGAQAVAAARSFLFVPATRPEGIGKALASGADCVIVDLEDAVTPQDKAAAREQLLGSLSASTPAELARMIVRINGEQTPWHHTDVAALAQRHGSLGGIMVPKAESAQALQALASAFGAHTPLVPLVESLAGLDAVDALARAPQVARLAFGHLDFQVDLGMQCQAGELELIPGRMAVVAASRRAHLPAPIDGVTTDTRNDEAVARDAARAKAIGFAGKLCIHPAQVRPVNEAFAPNAEEVEWARRVVAAAKAADGGAFTIDGRMVDLPVIRLAQRILETAKA